MTDTDRRCQKSPGGNDSETPDTFSEPGQNPSLTHPDISHDRRSARVDGEAARLNINDLFGRYRNKLLAYIQKCMVNQNEAEDVVQEVYYRAIQKDSIGDLEYPLAYLIQVAKNLLIDIDRYRRRQILSNYQALEESSDCPEFQGIPLEREVLAREELQEIGAALAELGPKCQVVFVMHRIEGETYQSIADQLGISVSMVEKYIVRAVRHLRKKYTIIANGKVANGKVANGKQAGANNGSGE